MGIDDMLKQQIRDRAPELKQKLVAEFSEVTQKDMDEASDDPDDIVDRVQKKTSPASGSSSVLRSLRDRRDGLTRHERSRRDACGCTEPTMPT
jgi:hypothetical protein